MTDHTRTEKIGGDSIHFYGHPSRVRNRYDSLATPLGTNRESDQYLVKCCLSCCFACLIYLFTFCDLFTAFYFVIFEYLCAFSCFGCEQESVISSHTLTCICMTLKLMPEFRPFRRKCWLRSCEIVISAMASQTLSEFMVLMTSWGSNLRTVIRKCSYSNRTLYI